MEMSEKKHRSVESAPVSEVSASKCKLRESNLTSEQTSQTLTAEAAKAEKIDVAGGERISKLSWERRLGDRVGFHIERDSQRRAASIEGWLQNRSGERPKGDVDVQKVFRKEHQLGRNQDAFHIIAYQHGGPTTSSHFKETVKSNLIAADGLINKSYHASFENQITKTLKEGTNLYCKATIHYRAGSES